MPEAHEELQELQENAEHAEHERSLAPVSLTMAVLAVVVAAVTLLGHRAHTEEGVLQTQIADRWNYYQAKNVRAYSYEILLDEMSFVPSKNPDAEAKIREKYEKALQRERDRQKEIQDEARNLEGEFRVERRRANRFDLGLGLLEAALVITSITLLTRKFHFWLFGLCVSIAGIAVTLTAFAFHL